MPIIDINVCVRDEKIPLCCSNFFTQPNPTVLQWSHKITTQYPTLIRKPMQLNPTPIQRKSKQVTQQFMRSITVLLQHTFLPNS